MTDIPSISSPSFLVEEVGIRHLQHLQHTNGGITKKFTSLSKSPVTYTTIYDPTIFRWDFGDDTPIVETDQRITYHTFAESGTYLIKHQACNFCTCSDWNICSQSIEVVPPVVSAGLPILLGAGLLFGYLVKKGKECGNYKTKEECEANECQWKKNKCIPFDKEDRYLIAKLREKGAVGTPICKGEECQIGKWVAIYRKGEKPIIIHDP